MRTMLFAALAFSAAANAQKVECPQTYPVVRALPKAGSDNRGAQKERASTPLSGGGVYEGPLEDRVELQGRYQKAKDGYNVQFGFPGNEIKWLVCTYGEDGELQWSEQMDRRSTDCVLQVRDQPQRGVSVAMACK